MQIKSATNSFCEKQSFKKREDATDMLIGLSKKHKKQKFRVYKCDLCGFFHLTTLTKKKKHLRSSKRKIDKYPVKMPSPIPANKRFVQPVGKNIVVHQKGDYSTGKILTKEMADALKQMIENNK